MRLVNENDLTLIGDMSFRATTAIAEHIVGGGVLLPGVGFAEMAFACCHVHRAILAEITFL